MSLISKSIPSLFNGVSQQPAPLRAPSQCEASVNAYPSIAVGLRKRPPTIHAAKLRNSAATDAFIHVFTHTSGTKYIVVLLDQDVEVYKEDGTACTITAADRAAWAASTAYSLNAYRRPTTPNGFLYRVTVAGTSGGSEPTWPTTLGNTVVDNTVTWQCVPDYLNVVTPRTDFATLTVGDAVQIVNKTVIAAMASGTASGSLSGVKQRFSDLPAATGSGNIWKVEGDNTSAFDNYYVKDVNDGGSFVWKEWLKPGETFDIDSATMPIALTRTGDTTFTLARNSWTPRAVGDTTTVNNPSFIGRLIQDVFVHRNRLGFIADERVIHSKSASFFDFYPDSATTNLDSDPIDVSSASTKTGKLRHAIPFNRALLLFSGQTQYQFSGGDLLTYRTARIDPVTEFESDPACKPVAVGQEVFFSVKRGEYSAIRNYFIDTEALTNDATEVTAHVPSYIPKEVFKLAVSTTEDVMFALTLQERNAIYVYKWYWADDKKAQSAWQKFTFDAGDTILSADFINNVAYLLVQRSDGVYLDTMDMQPAATDAGMGLLVHLDRRTSLTGVFSSADNWTTWTLPYADSGAFDVVLGAGFTGSVGEPKPTTRPSTTTVRVTGADLSASPCFVGRRYEMDHTLSEIHFKDKDGQPVLSGRLMLRRAVVNYSNSSYFTISVTPLARSAYTYYYTGVSTGLSDFRFGVPAVLDGTFRFPIQSENRGCVIRLKNDSPFPSNFQTLEWEGEFTLKSSRQG